MPFSEDVPRRRRLTRPVTTLLAVSLLGTAELIANAWAGASHPEEISQKAVVRGTFAYEFTESTGPNQSIWFEGREKDIEFDKAWSKPEALHSLSALRWNVLYPNSSDGHITIDGTYNEVTGRFILRGWHLRTPFKRAVILKEDEIPQQQRVVVADHLRRADFKTTPEFNSRAARFDPRLYETGTVANAANAAPCGSGRR